MRRVRRTAAIAAALALAAAAGAAWWALRHPSIELHAGELLPAAAPRQGAVRATFLGCTTLLFDDGETQLLVDGFLSRPGGLRVLFGRIAPDEARIEAALARAGVERLAAVMTAHSHYDHAMDAPVVARRTGALLIGSRSTANLARGLELPEQRLRVVAGGERFEFGAFTVSVLPALHTPGRGGAPGTIDAPLVPPARHADYREGGCFSFHVAHPAGSALVQASTNFVPGAFADLRADVLFLGTARLGRLDDAFAREWWRETAAASGARIVIPIHWDDFTQPLDEPLQPMPMLMDDFTLGMRRLRELARASGVRLGRMAVFEPVEILPPPLSDRAR